MEKRFKFKCWNCNMEYSLFKEITTQQELIVPCPFCNAEGVVKLEPHRKIVVLKGDDAGDQATIYEYHFPEVIPTHKPE